MKKLSPFVLILALALQASGWSDLCANCSKVAEMQACHASKSAADDQRRDVFSSSCCCAVMNCATTEDHPQPTLAEHRLIDKNQGLAGRASIPLPSFLFVHFSAQPSISGAKSTLQPLYLLNNTLLI